MTKSKPPTPERHVCALCGQTRTHGGLLRAGDTDKAETMWVCEDCQHKLIRRVDDEGVKGG